jgi:hypothetical protein
MKFSKLTSELRAIVVLAVLVPLTACSATAITALETDAEQGLIVAQDVYTAYNAVVQTNVGTGKLSASKVLTAAQAAQTSANSTGLPTAVDALVSDANATITAMQATNAPPAAIVTNVDVQEATNEIQAAAVVSTTN